MSLISNINEFTVLVDGNPTTYNSEPSGNSWLISISYHHSTHEVTMEMNNAPTPQTNPTPTPKAYPSSSTETNAPPTPQTTTAPTPNPTTPPNNNHTEPSLTKQGIYIAADLAIVAVAAAVYIRIKNAQKQKLKNLVKLKASITIFPFADPFHFLSLVITFSHLSSRLKTA
jgi:phosphotransferase system  glucose/maltose/N-acetylglucosamine-specific IIC component